MSARDTYAGVSGALAGAVRNGFDGICRDSFCRGTMKVVGCWQEDNTVWSGLAENGLQVYMCELPNNVLMAEEFSGV